MYFLIYGLIFNLEQFNIINVRDSSWMMKKNNYFWKKKNNSIYPDFMPKKNHDNKKEKYQHNKIYKKDIKKNFFIFQKKLNLLFN